MGDAYAYADSETPVPRPPELAQLAYIDRFGVAAVMGRPFLWAGELRRMTAAENVLVAYTGRQRAENWQAWARSNPMLAESLAQAGEIAKGENYLDRIIKDA